jgi:hypothetical protein
MEPETIKAMAEENGWIEIDHQENICMISFAKEFARINVYYSKMTVATSLNHPKKGKTQLFRRNVSEKFMRKIFVNPRVHTNHKVPYHGYRLKKDYKK